MKRKVRNTISWNVIDTHMILGYMKLKTAISGRKFSDIKI